MSKHTHSSIIRITLAAAVTTAGVSWSERARADESEVATPSPDYVPAQSDPQASQPLLSEYVPDTTIRHRRPYRDGMRVPEGYHVESSPSYGLIAAGASVTGALWIISLGAAIALDNSPDGSDDPNFDDNYSPMFIPVAGPFATIATADASGTGAAILALDGAAQVAGLAMFIAGFISQNHELVPDEQDVVIAPTFSPEMSGLTISGKL